jgi:hypothetical protein
MKEEEITIEIGQSWYGIAENNTICAIKIVDYCEQEKDSYRVKIKGLPNNFILNKKDLLTTYKYKTINEANKILFPEKKETALAVLENSMKKSLERAENGEKETPLKIWIELMPHFKTIEKKQTIKFAQYIPPDCLNFSELFDLQFTQTLD